MLSTTYPHISPFVFIIGTFSFVCSFFVHLEIWRTLRPGKQMGLLTMIFVLGPVCLFISLFVAGQLFQSPGSWFVRNPFNLSCVFIWHLALSAAYIMSYPAIQAESPSLVMLLAIAESMPQGLNARQIENTFPPDALINDRANDLHAEGFMRRRGDQDIPTAKGRLLCGIFTSYRRLLGLPRGEG